MKPTILITLATTLLCAAGCTSEPDAVTMEVTRVACTHTGVLSYDVTIRNDSDAPITLADWDAAHPENNFILKADTRTVRSDQVEAATPARPLTLRPAQAVRVPCSLRVKAARGLHHADVTVKSQPTLHAQFSFELMQDTDLAQPARKPLL